MLGNGGGLFRCGAFAAARVRRHQSKIFGSGIPIIPPQPRIPRRLTSCRQLSSAPHLGFLSARSTLRSSVACLPLPPGKLPVCLGAGLLPGAFFTEGRLAPN